MTDPWAYGLDEYSRYVENKHGERVAIESYPYFNPWRKIRARIDIIKWHLAVLRTGRRHLQKY